jgi:hypothetical protein
MSKSTYFCCNVHAFSQAQRTRYHELTKKLAEACIEVHELPDDYASRSLPEKLSLVDLAEFVSFESRCCPWSLGTGFSTSVIWTKSGCPYLV